MLSEKMAISAALGGNIRALASQPHRPHDHYHLWLNEKQKFPFVLRTQNRKRYSTLIVRSTLNKLESDLSNSDNRATEPARALLEILFAQTLKMEEKMSRHSGTSEDNELSINLEVLESDIRAALLALINTGEDLQDAERKVMSDQTELIRTKENLEHREEEIAASCAKQKQMEENLKKANGDLSCQARQIEDLKLLVEEQNRKITHSQSTLSLKLDELDRVRNELMKKTKEAAIMKSKLESRDQLLYEANEIIKKQGAEIQELQKEVKDKECGLAKSLHLRKVEEERLKIAEANLEKQTVDWLSARRELNVLAEQASKNTNDVKETSKDVKRVEKLLSVVRSELISSQESLASSRRKLDDQAHQLEKQQLQLNEQKLSMMSYTKSLKDAQTEVENERTKWRAAQTQKEELELKLALERELLERVQEDLNKEKFFLEHATQEIASLQKELHQKQMEFSDAQALLQVKESELVEARLEIQNLKSEAASLQLILNEKDQAIWSAQNKLADVNSEIADLKTLNDSKEDQLILATGRLKKKEELALVMQHDLDDIKFKFSEVVTVIERIAQLTSELVSSAEGSISSCLLGKGILATEVEEDAKMQKQLDTELVSMKELLRVKEIELLTARRALTVKDEELNAVTSMWNAREKEMAKMKEGLWEDSNGGLKKSYALAQERVGGKSIMKNLAIEKLQLNTSWFEAKAINTDKCMGLDIGSVTLPTNDVSLHRRDECLEEAGREVANLLALTENLVEDAGIGGTGDTVL